MFEDYEYPFLECGLGKLVEKKVQTRLESKVFSLEILIFLIWTNVPRTNDAWTDVVVTFAICCICSQDPSFKV